MMKIYIMFLYLLLVIPLVGVFLISTIRYYSPYLNYSLVSSTGNYYNLTKENLIYKKLAFTASILNLIISLIIYILFDFSNNQFQFIQEHYDISFYDIYLGVDGISIYFVLLTTIIMPIALISNWNSITNNIRSYLIIMFLLETLLLAVFLVLDIIIILYFFWKYITSIIYINRFIWIK